MPDYFKRVQAGDPLDIKAPTWNAMLEAAQAHQSRMQGGGAPGTARVITPDVVDVYNDSGTGVGAFEVLGVDDVLVAPSADLQQFVNRPCLRGVAPTEEHAGKFVVTTNAIPAGGIGRAVVLGATVCKVDMQAADDRYADVYAGDTTKLKSGTTGPARILHVEAGTGVQWAVVRIDGGRGEGSGDPLPAPTALYQVLQCTQFTNADTYTIAFDWVRAH